MPQADPVADRLRRAPVAPEVRADAWDAFHAARDADDLTRRISALKIPDDVKADLWDIKSGVPLAVKPAAARAPGLATIGEQLNSKYGSAEGSRQVGDLWKGIGAGAMSTVLHGGDLVRRGWNALVPESMETERIIERPEVAAYMQPPDSLPGQVGFYGEQAAEFAVPLTKLSNAYKGAGVLKRIGVDALASAGVAGVQSGGDSTQMGVAAAGGAVLPFGGAVARGARRAAAGAAEGGVGGAVAGAIRTVAPSEPHVMLTQALKPRSTKTNFTGSLAKAMPEIKASEATIGKPIESIEEMLEGVKVAKKRVRAQFDQIAGPKRAIGTEVDLSAVADAVEKSIPAKLKLENPKAAAAMIDQVGVYRRKFGLEEAEQLWMETNAELEAFYNKYPIAQRKALRADPEAARLVAQGDALRTAIYKTLDDGGQTGAARELNRRYGALLDVENEATRRVNVANRQQPESLSEQIGGVRAAGDIAKGAWRLSHGDLSGAADIASGAAQRSTSKFLKEQQTTNSLIKRAMAGVTTKPGAIPVPPVRPVRGLLGPGARPMSAGPDTSGPIPHQLPENINRPPVVQAAPEPVAVVERPGAVAERARAVIDDAAVIAKKRPGAKPFEDKAIHITTTENAAGIRRDGFKTGKQGLGGDDFGQGVYLVDARSDAGSFWRQQLETRDASGTVPTEAMKSRVRLESPLVLEDIPPHAGSYKRPSHQEQLRRAGAGDLVPAYEKKIADGMTENRALGTVARESGYDGLRILRRGGDEIIAFDPKSVQWDEVPRKSVATKPDSDAVPDFGIPDAPQLDPKVERSFMLRWLADDLDEMPFQQGGNTPKGRRAAYETLDKDEAHALTFNPHVAGTPTQEMFHAVGITGSRKQIASQLKRTLEGKKTSPKLDALADAMREAWDGQRFDWQLVSDETVAKLGIRRRDFKSPVTTPNQDDMPDVYARFFGEPKQ